MKLIFKIAALAFVLAVLFGVSFALWGTWFEQLFTRDACIAWFTRIKVYGWAAGIGLLLADLLLPIPATGIMAAMGSVYGVFWGTIVSSVGSAGAGLVGYGFARLLGRRGVRFLASEAELDRFRAVFNTWGGGAVIISRMLPILPEVISILAGIAPMRIGAFVSALLLGTVPTCFVFVYMGHLSKSVPGYGMAAAIFVPLLLWPLFLKLFVNGKSIGEQSAPAPAERKKSVET